MLEQWAFGVAGQCLVKASPRRWAHVIGVAARARQAAPAFGADADLLIAAAYLHDVGYAPELAATGFHPLDGARYLASINAPKRLVDLVARHSGAINEAELRGLATELTVFEDEQTAIRDALWWADMTTTPNGRQTTLNDRVEEITRRYGTDHVVPQAIRQSWPELRKAVERTEARLS